MGAMVGSKNKMPIQPIAHNADDLSHRQRCQYRADAEPFQMPQEQKGHAGRYDETDRVKRNFDFRIADIRDLC